MSAEGSKQELLAALIEAYENLALEADKQPTVKLAQAILYLEGGQLETAVKTVEQFLLLAPDNQRGLLFLVQTLQQQDRMTEALSRLEEALQRMPDNQSLRLQYARFLTITDRPKAIVQFEMLRLKNPDNQQVNFLLALLYLNQGSVERAVDLFKQAASDPSLYADAQYHLGSIADRQGDIGERTGCIIARFATVAIIWLPLHATALLLLAELQSMDIARTYLQQLRARTAESIAPLCFRLSPIFYSAVTSRSWPLQFLVMACRPIPITLSCSTRDPWLPNCRIISNLQNGICAVCWLRMRIIRRP